MISSHVIDCRTRSIWRWARGAPQPRRNQRRQFLRERLSVCLRNAQSNAETQGDSSEQEVGQNANSRTKGGEAELENSPRPSRLHPIFSTRYARQIPDQGSEQSARDQRWQTVPRAQHAQSYRGHKQWLLLRAMDMRISQRIKRLDQTKSGMFTYRTGVKVALDLFGG
jgi:hypothetical protein